MEMPRRGSKEVKDGGDGRWDNEEGSTAFSCIRSSRSCVSFAFDAISFSVYIGESIVHTAFTFEAR